MQLLFLLRLGLRFLKVLWLGLVRLRNLLPGLGLGLLKLLGLCRL